MIAEAFPPGEQLVTKDFLDARVGELRVEMHRGFASLNRSMLGFMASLWLGIAGLIVTNLLKG